MKREHTLVTAWAILLCFALVGCTKTFKCYCVTEADKCVFDSTELNALRAENKKIRNDNYWLGKERNELRQAKPDSGKRDVTYIKTMDGDFILTDRIFKDK